MYAYVCSFLGPFFPLYIIPWRIDGDGETGLLIAFASFYLLSLSTICSFRFGFDSLMYVMSCLLGIVSRESSRCLEALLLISCWQSSQGKAFEADVNLSIVLFPYLLCY